MLKRFGEDQEKVEHVVEYYKDISLKDYTYNKEDRQFTLDAVSLHSGGVWGGHYTAYVVKGENSWICDDSWVEKGDINYQDDRAYVLSYSTLDL